MSGTPIVPSVFDSQKKHIRIIAWVTGLLTLTVAAFAFTLSFTALTDLARQHGVSIPILFPLIVEAGVIIFSLNALYRSLQGERASWQWCLIIGSSLAAGVFNVLHAEAVVISQIIAAMPSLFLLLSFETFMGQIKHAVQKSTAIQTLISLRKEIEVQRQTLENTAADKRKELDAYTQEVEQQLEQLQARISEAETELSSLETKRQSVQAEINQLRQDKKRLKTSNLSTLGKANATRRLNKHKAQEALLEYYAQHPNASLVEAGRPIGRAKSAVRLLIEDEVEVVTFPAQAWRR